MLGQEIKKKFDSLVQQKSTWLPLYQELGEYVSGLEVEFTADTTRGQRLNNRVYDATGINASSKMSNAFMGMLWPSAARSIKLKKPKNLSQTNETKTYYEHLTEAVVEAFDNPKSGFAVAHEEYWNDQGDFGTSGIGAFDDEELPVIFRAYGISGLHISEGKNAVVDTVYYSMDYKLERAVKEFGIDNLSNQARADYKRDPYKKIKIIHAIEPRIKRDATKSGVFDLPIRSVYVEHEACHVIKESGFHEFPIPVCRFMKRKTEAYGRSKAMQALPDILRLNSVEEASILALEQMLDPPKGVYEECILGNGSVDFSPGALNVFKASGRAGNANPVFDISGMGDVRAAQIDKEALREAISNHFMLDKLLDFNNQTQMTAREAMMRDRIRSQSLNGFLSKQIAELYQPLIERVVNILFRKGELGVIEGSIEHREKILNGEKPVIIPREVAKLIGSGKDFYKIEYFTPAAKLMQSDQVEGVYAAWEFAGNVAQAKPEVFDLLDPDESLRIVADSMGSPSSIIQAKDTVEGIRQARAEAQAQQNQAMEMQEGLQAAEQVAEIQNKQGA